MYLNEDQLAPTKTVKVYLKPGRNGELPFGNYEKFRNASVNLTDSLDDGRLVIRDAATNDVMALFGYNSWSHIIVEDT